MVLLDGSYNIPCSNSTSKAVTTLSCEAGFMLDQTAGVCYMVLQGLMNFDTAKTSLSDFFKFHQNLLWWILFNTIFIWLLWQSLAKVKINPRPEK